jgi:hypothetical protein
VEEKRDPIKLGIDAGFFGPVFSEKVISEGIEQGLIFETEPELLLFLL